MYRCWHGGDGGDVHGDGNGEACGDVHGDGNGEACGDVGGVRVLRAPRPSPQSHPSDSHDPSPGTLPRYPGVPAVTDSAVTAHETTVFRDGQLPHRAAYEHH